MAKGLGLLKSLSRKAGFAAMVSLGAGLHGFASGQAGHRRDSATEGAILGALAGAAAVSAPSFAKVVFRRIRGRIIPIKVK